MNVIKCIGKYKIFYVKFVILIPRVTTVDLLHLKIPPRNILNNADIYSDSLFVYYVFHSRRIFLYPSLVNAIEHIVQLSVVDSSCSCRLDS